MKALNRRRLSALRWFVQLSAFAILMYGGFAVSGLSSALDEPQLEAGRPPDPAGGVKQAYKRETSTDLFLPATVCVYQRQGLCKGCSLYFLSDALSWQRSLDSILPHLLVLVLLMLLAGRLWCGWICPLGLVSDLLTQVRVYLGISQARISRRWREGLVWTKYVLLVLSLGIATMAGLEQMAGTRLSWVDPFCQVCPARIFEAFFTFDEVCWTNWRDSITTVFSIVGLVAFGLFFIGLTVRRFWCRLCPIGGLTALLSRSGLVMLTKDAVKCTRCGACARNCPLDVRRVFHGRGLGPVTTGECHLCLRCVDACPEQGCLQLRWLGQKVSGS